MGTVTGVRNAAIVAAAPVGSNGLWPLLVLRLLGALRLLALRLLGALRLRLLRTLLWLRFLRTLLWLRLLGALLWLRLLGALLRLSFLFVLRLRLVLRRLGFFSASGLFLLSFLCECRNGGSEK
jgi:hypothetical protein